VKTRRVLIVVDNVRLAESLNKMAVQWVGSCDVHVVCSPLAPPEVRRHVSGELDLVCDCKRILSCYDFLFSAHCRQIIPSNLYSAMPCVNIHPGCLPETRGWFPHVWSIIYGLPAGFTVHVVDGIIDHGSILYREEVNKTLLDTSESLYSRVLSAELSWIKDNFFRLVNGGFSPVPQSADGRVFSKADFDRACHIDLNETGSFRDFFDRLRALSHEGFKNAYVVDELSGDRVYLQVQLYPGSFGVDSCEDCK